MLRPERHFRPLVTAGHVFVAMPPLFRVDIGKQVFYAVADAHIRRVIADMAEDKGAALAADLKGAATFLKTDVLDEQSVAQAIDAATRQAPLRAAVKRSRIVRWRSSA